jgi:hypothetical protein
MFKSTGKKRGNDPREALMDQILSEGFRAIPTPVPSPDFDERVLAGLRDSAPSWYVALRNSLKPMLTAMTGSFILGLLAIHFALQAPTPTLTPTKSAPINYQAMQRLIDSPNLSTMYWWRYSLLSVSPPRPPARLEAPALDHSEIPIARNKMTV